MAGQFVNKNTIGLLLGGCHLSRCTATGVVEPLTVEQVVNLIFSGGVQPGQAESYLGVLQAHQHAKQKAELKEVAVNLAKSHGDQPETLLAGVEKLVAEARKGGFTGGEECQSELFELIPYMKDLTEQQTGTEFLGLDSGFQHVNNLCNGLYAGLGIIAAPPGPARQR